MRRLLVASVLTLAQFVPWYTVTTVGEWTVDAAPSGYDLPTGFVDLTYTLPTGCEEIDVGAALPAGCAIITVDAGQNFQTALTTAAGRTGATSDIIRLAGASSFQNGSSSFTLPTKSGTGWVYIISTGYANLPAFMNRVIPDDMAAGCGNADQLYCVSLGSDNAYGGVGGAADTAATPNVTMGADVATIVGGSSSPFTALTFADSATKYRFIGVELRAPSGQFATSLIRIADEGSPTDSSGPSFIIFDRVVCRGDPTVGGRRCFQTGGDDLAIINSYISNWWESGTDTQAITPQIFTDRLAFINNYAEAGGENYFPDAQTGTTSEQPSDLEVRWNYFRKANNWRATCNTLNVKNLLEVKTGHRLLVEGNEFADTWNSISPGHATGCGQEAAFNIKQGIEDVGKHTTNVIIRKNRIVRVGNIFKLCHTGCNGANTTDGFQFAVYNNIGEADADVYGESAAAGDGAPLYHLATGGAGMLVTNNTLLVDGPHGVAALNLGAGSPSGGDFRNNILLSSVGGWEMIDTATADAIWPGGYTHTDNLLVGGTCGNFPAGNQCPASYAAVTFVNYNGGVNGDYTLDAASPYKGDADDIHGIGSTDPGANVPVVLNAVSCAITGQCASYAPLAPAPKPVPFWFVVQPRPSAPQMWRTR